MTHVVGLEDSTHPIAELGCADEQRWEPLRAVAAA